MTEKELRTQLEYLQQLKAPKSVHKFVEAKTVNLSEKRGGWYFPLVMFRVGFAIAVLLLFVLATSGVVVAAVQSTPGSMLYPVKQVIRHLPIIHTAMPTPTSVPNHTIKPTDMPTPIKGQEKKINQGEKKNDNSTKAVKGIHSEVSRSPQTQQKSVRLQPTLTKQQQGFHFSFDIFQHGKNQK